MKHASALHWLLCQSDTQSIFSGLRIENKCRTLIWFSLLREHPMCRITSCVNAHFKCRIHSRNSVSVVLIFKGFNIIDDLQGREAESGRRTCRASRKEKRGLNHITMITFECVIPSIHSQAINIQFWFDCFV